MKSAASKNGATRQAASSPSYSEVALCKIYFVVVRSFTTDGGVNSTPHTSHSLVDTHSMTRTCVAQAQGWRAQCTFQVISCVIFMRSCCVFDSPRLLPFPLLAVCLLSYRLFHLLNNQLLLPRCGGQIPCAIPLMRTLAPLPSTTLSHLRHGHLPREEDGAIEFWRSKDHLRHEFVHSQHWSDELWKRTTARGGGNKKRFQYCTVPFLSLRALQSHSGRNLMDPSLQENVSFPSDFFEYIFHIGCAINSHSITNSGLIPGQQILSKRQTVSFTADADFGQTDFGQF